MATYVDPKTLTAILLGKTSMQNVVPRSFMPTVPAPLPRPDPRGSTFVDRLPKAYPPAELLGETGVIQAPSGISMGRDVFPTELLMHQKGYPTSPDINTYSPQDIMRARLQSIPFRVEKI